MTACLPRKLAVSNSEPSQNPKIGRIALVFFWGLVALAVTGAIISAVTMHRYGDNLPALQQQLNHWFVQPFE